MGDMSDTLGKGDSVRASGEGGMEVPPERQLNEPRRHHYVPEFLLRPWARNWTNGQLQLRGHYWDTHRKTLRYRQNGVGAFCHSIDLLTLRGRR